MSEEKILFNRLVDCKPLRAQKILWDLLKVLQVQILKHLVKRIQSINNRIRKRLILSAVLQVSLRVDLAPLLLGGLVLLQEAFRLEAFRLECKHKRLWGLIPAQAII